MVHWSEVRVGKMENLVKPFVLTVKQDLSPPRQQVPNLELMVRNPEQSAFGLSWKMETQKVSPGFMAMEREVALLVKTGSGVYEILKTVVIRNCCLSIGAGTLVPIITKT